MVCYLVPVALATNIFNTMNRLPPRFWRNPKHVLAFGFGAGALTRMPGTIGTLVAFPLWWPLQYLSLPSYLAVVALLFLIGVHCCDVTARHLGVPDHSGIVWDEIVAFLLVLTVIPATFFWLVLAFALFRLFDIWKPWPISWMDQHIKGGIGIMLDDLVAALFAMVCLGLLQFALGVAS